MTLQIDLTPELEAKLRARAAAMGKDPSSFVRDVMEYELEDGESDDLTSSRTKLSFEQRIAEFHEWMANHPPLPYEVDDSRESIYEGRGE